MFARMLSVVWLVSAWSLVAPQSMAGEPIQPLTPYTGPHLKIVDTTTLNGKVMTGYQGWFNCQGDGADLGWTHWAANGRGPMGPGNVSVDLWPDVTELNPDEQFETGFKDADGNPVKVFSSHRRETVLRHFRWMRDYGIDGAFVQRFANGVKSAKLRHHKDVVLANCREGANREGRAYAVMYDLSGLRSGETQNVKDDWQLLRQQMRIGDDKAYLHHRGKPLVAIWGVGFNDGRKYSLEECRDLIEFLKDDGCSVMLGVPTGWRTLDRDSIREESLQQVCKLADVISPWTVGRYRTPEDVTRHGKRDWRPDIAWCGDAQLDYLPVVFPGFSWHNLKRSAPLNEIPRLRGQFLWSQFVAAKKAGATMVYVAMFDEVDEATAIFKCVEPPASAKHQFLSSEGLPSDHYLWLTGRAAQMMASGTIDETMPTHRDFDSR